MFLTLEMMKRRFGSNPNVRFREETVGGRSVTIVCYMVADDNLWALDYGVETRGPCFDTVTGELLSLPFEKFFNLNEKSHTQHPLIRDAMSRSVTHVCEKVDGSMITPVMINGEIYLKTKKSFSSDVAKAAQVAMTREVENLCRDTLKNHITPIFEFTSPDAKIVIDYGDKPQFKLLALREMHTGNYMPMSMVKYNGEMYGVAHADFYTSHDLDSLIEDGAGAEGIEGWVLYIGSTRRVKIKTKWYLDRHRMLDVRERDVARYVLEDVLDDLIPSMIEGEADMDAIRGIEAKIAHDLSQLRSRIDTASAIAATYEDGAERAKWINSTHSDIAGFVFRQSRGMDVDDSNLKEWYTKRHLRDFSLRSVGNPQFSRVTEDV